MTLRPAIALLVGATMALSACSQVGEVVDDAQSQVEQAGQTIEFCAAAVRLADAVDDQDVDAAVAAGEDFVDNAPDEILPDAQLVLDAARQAQEGDTAAIASEEVRAAGERIRTFTTDRCTPGTDAG